MLHPRLRIALSLLFVIGVACVAAAAIARSQSTPTPASSQAATRFAGPTLPPGLRASDFSLPDQDGKPASLSQYRGQVVVVTFLYSHCTNTCPVTAQQIRGAFDDLGRDVPALAISVDPANDTPESTRQFLVKQYVNGRIRFLLGSQQQLAPVWKSYFVSPQSQGLDHTAFVYLVDRRGQLRIGFPAQTLTPEALAHDLRMLLAEPA